MINTRLWMCIVNNRAIFTGSLGIAPTRNCTHFLKIGYVVARGGVFSNKGINQSKKGKLEENIKFYAYKKILYIFLKMGAIPRLPYSVSTILCVSVSLAVSLVLRWEGKWGGLNHIFVVNIFSSLGVSRWVVVMVELCHYFKKNLSDFLVLR